MGQGTEEGEEEGRSRFPGKGRHTHIRFTENDVNYAANNDEEVKNIPGITKVTLHEGGREGQAGWGLKRKIRQTRTEQHHHQKQCPGTSVILQEFQTPSLWPGAQGGDGGGGGEFDPLALPSLAHGDATLPPDSSTPAQSFATSHQGRAWVLVAGRASYNVWVCGCVLLASPITPVLFHQ